MPSPAPNTKSPKISSATEDQLARRLTPRQLGMIALGGAIGTGLFLGSGISVRVAGPAVILAYLAGAFPALVIAWALAEMAVAHPVAGSFGVYAEIYVNPWAGFTMRYAYWFGQVIATGSEIVAAALYFSYWFPGVPRWVAVVAFSCALLVANAWSVASFGEFEYWFALIKVATIVGFLILGASLLTGFGWHSSPGFSNYTQHGGFLPNGWKGVLEATTMAVFSYFGIEVVAVTAGEARDPERTIPRALRTVFWRLALFYVGSIGILVGLISWEKVGLDASPFVRAFEALGLPAASSVMNFVVLTAALSSANTNLYLTTRMLFSLAHGGYAPKLLAKLTRRGIPLWALAASSAGMAVAVMTQKFVPEKAYLYLVGTAFFGGLYVWVMILVAHLAFRNAREKKGDFKRLMRFSPYSTWAGLVALGVVGVMTLFVPGLRITLLGGLPWLGLMTCAYWIMRARRKEHA